MATASDFVVFRDQSFDLSDQQGADSDRDLDNIIDDDPISGEGGLLTWNVRREGNGSVDYEIEINGTFVNRYTVSERNWHSVQERFPTGSIQQGENTVRYHVTGGDGTLSVGDVVLFYRKNIQTGPSLVPAG